MLIKKIINKITYNFNLSLTNLEVQIMTNIKNSIISNCIKYPKSIITISFLISFFFILGIPRIVQDDDMVRLLPDDLPSIKTFADITDEFGNYEFMYVAVGNKGRDIFSPDFLQTAWNISKELEDLKECEEIISISTMSKMYYDLSDSSIVVDDLVTKASLNNNEIDEIKKYLDDNKLVRSRIISNNDDYINILLGQKITMTMHFLLQKLKRLHQKIDLIIMVKKLNFTLVVKHI